MKKSYTLLLILFSVYLPGQVLSSERFRFAVASDMRYAAGWGGHYGNAYFQGACKAIAELGGCDFMICPGDLGPVWGVDYSIRQVFGDDFVWYPVVGNHDKPFSAGGESYPGENLDWIRAHNVTLPYIVNWGPVNSEKTTYSFDYENVHFVVINEYYDGIVDSVGEGDVCDPLYEWLVEDLNATEKEHIFVIGHEPAFPQPDADTGVLRHKGNSLDLYPEHRDRFWNLLKEKGVFAYIHGHTHGYSIHEQDGVWEWADGIAMGKADTRFLSTFLMVDVDNEKITLEVYRDDHDGIYDYDDYRHTWSNHILVETKIVLEGPYSLVSSSMVPHLNTKGFIPTTSPYPEDPRTVSAIPEDVVDWILIELKDKAENPPMYYRSAFLHKDGRIVEDDGTTRQIPIPGTEGAYHVVVSHRNHLPVMSREPVQLRYKSSELYDFTLGADRYYGSAAKLLNTDPVVYGMYGADISGDGVIRLADELNELRINNLQFGYINADVDLNGVVSLASELTRVRKNNLQVTKVK
ncbi:metallophosphoesterase family protein [bacterium]